MPVSEAKKKANARWNASKDNIMLRPTKEEGAAIRAAAAIAGQSNQQYILQATRERMERDSGTVSQIAQNGPESTAGAEVVYMPSDALKAAQEAAGTEIQPTHVDKVKAAENLFHILGDLGTVDLDKARCERLGIMYLPPDILETAQQAAERTGETVVDFVARAVEEQQRRDDRSFKMGINPA
uniref:Uncharacterized protein n=1 Tax=uncultured prokaryote TaxID=198431 RepID=A0A0H5Q9K4_9ZZZZ|nr:hypothetical protein [uncultured prokaryote]